MQTWQCTHTPMCVHMHISFYSKWHHTVPLQHTAAHNTAIQHTLASIPNGTTAMASAVVASAHIAWQSLSAWLAGNFSQKSAPYSFLCVTSGSELTFEYFTCNFPKRIRVLNKRSEKIYSVHGRATLFLFYPIGSENACWKWKRRIEHHEHLCCLQHVIIAHFIAHDRYSYSLGSGATTADLREYHS